MAESTDTRADAQAASTMDLPSRLDRLLAEFRRQGREPRNWLMRLSVWAELVERNAVISVKREERRYLGLPVETMRAFRGPEFALVDIDGLQLDAVQP